MEMEKAAGSAEKTEKMYEDYNARLVDSARREAEKHLKAKVQLDTNAADWVAWVTLLSSASRKLQARADAASLYGNPLRYGTVSRTTSGMHPGDPSMTLSTFVRFG